MRRYCIYVLIFCVAVLIALGLVMLFSTGAFARDSHGDMYFFIKRQIVWLVISVVVCTIGAFLNYEIWRKTWWVWLGVSVVLLALCFVPGVGMKINGSHRWLNLGLATFQPSEIAKVGILIFLAWYYAKPERSASHFWKGVVVPFLVISVPLTLIVLEVDLGTTALLVAMTLCMMFVAGLPWKQVVLGTLVGGGGLLYVATHIPERLGRLVAFLNPEKYSASEGFQQMQAIIAFGSGGIYGLGLGEGRQKMSYLPYAHTDFIFPMVGEELGLRVTLLTVFGFLLIMLCGAMISINVKDRFGMFLGFGATMLLAIQSIVNIGVTISLLPNKGMPLPFISYGGSNLLMCLFLVGLLISVYRHGGAATIPVARYAMTSRALTRSRR